MVAWAVAGRRDNTSSNSVRETNIDVNTLASSPMDSVVAKPRIGPVPNWNRNAGGDHRRDVGVEERQEDAVEARSHRRTRRRGPRELLLDPLEDQHVRVDAHAHRQDEARDARQGHRRAEYAMKPMQDDQVRHIAMIALIPDSL